MATLSSKYAGLRSTRRVSGFQQNPRFDGDVDFDGRSWPVSCRLPSAFSTRRSRRHLDLHGKVSVGVRKDFDNKIAAIMPYPVPIQHNLRCGRCRGAAESRLAGMLDRADLRPLARRVRHPARGRWGQVLMATCARPSCTWRDEGVAYALRAQGRREMRRSIISPSHDLRLNHGR